MSIDSNEGIDLSTLPPLPASWVWCLPADICSTVASGSTPSPDKMFEGGGDIPFIKVYNLTHNGLLDFTVKPTFISRETHEGLLSRSRTQPGDVLINIVGPPLGKVSLVPDKYAEWNINQAIVVFRPHYGVSNRYIAYAFLTEAIMKRVTKLAKATAGQFNIGVSMCRKLLPVPLAPAMEQLRIVAKIEELFSDLDAGVVALERVRANLKRYRAAVLKAAVVGKLTEDWRAQHPDTEPAFVLLERILTERRRQWEKEQLAKFAQAGKQPPKGWREKYPEPEPIAAELEGGLPEGWCWTTWDQISEWVTYGFTRPMPHVQAGIPIITAKHVSRRKIDFEITHKTSIDAYQELSDKDRPMEGDILITKDGTIGRAAVVPKFGDFCINQSVAVVWTRRSPLHPNFLLSVIDSELTQKPISAKARGVAIQHLSITDFAKLPLPLPSRQEQDAIVSEVDRRLSIVDEIEAQVDANLKRAARLRQGILKRAFEGRLVPQDPTDEPAEKLLERIRQQRRTASPSENGSPRTRRARRPRNGGTTLPLFSRDDEPDNGLVPP